MKIQHKESPHEPTRRMFQRARNVAKLHHKINMLQIRRNDKSRNKILADQAAAALSRHRERFGIKIPNTINQALRFDREAGNNKWAEAIKKEMNNYAPEMNFPKQTVCTRHRSR